MCFLKEEIKGTFGLNVASGVRGGHPGVYTCCCQLLRSIANKMCGVVCGHLIKDRKRLYMRNRSSAVFHQVIPTCKVVSDAFTKL